MEVGLALFAEEVEIELAPTTARERVIEAVVDSARTAKLGPPPANCIVGFTSRQREMFAPLQPGDVLYAITDGVDNFSETRPAAVTEAFQAVGIRLFAFAIANQGFAYGSGELERVVEDRPALSQPAARLTGAPSGLLPQIPRQ